MTRNASCWGHRSRPPAMLAGGRGRGYWLARHEGWKRGRISSGRRPPASAGTPSVGAEPDKRPCAWQQPWAPRHPRAGAALTKSSPSLSPSLAPTHRHSGVSAPASARRGNPRGRHPRWAWDQAQSFVGPLEEAALLAEVPSRAVQHVLEDKWPPQQAISSAPRPCPPPGGHLSSCHIARGVRDGVHSEAHRGSSESRL